MDVSISEFRMEFRKSSHSGSSNPACVEVAVAGRRFFVRDSKDPAGGMICLDLMAARRLIAKLRD